MFFLDIFTAYQQNEVKQPHKNATVEAVMCSTLNMQKVTQLLVIVGTAVCLLCYRRIRVTSYNANSVPHSCWWHCDVLYIRRGLRQLQHILTCVSNI